MRIFMYVMILAVVAMSYKTFYWDYQPKEVQSEVNTSIETPAVSEAEAVPVQTVETKKIILLMSTIEPVGKVEKECLLIG